MMNATRISSLEIERARESLKRGETERALSWLEEGVAHAAEASDEKLLRHLADEAAALGEAMPKFRSRAQALEREARKLAKRTPIRGRNRRWRRPPKEDDQPKEVAKTTDAPGARKGVRQLNDFISLVAERYEHDRKKEKEA